MSSYFCNTVLRGADPDAVGRAIINWQSSENCTLDSTRQRFDHYYGDQQRRFFILNRDDWTIVLAVEGLEEAAGLAKALAPFPIVVQLWADDLDWGFRLAECGAPTAQFNFKPSTRRNANCRESLVQLATACGCPDCVERLYRIAKRTRTLFSEKPTADFAAALGVPLAAIDARTVDGWNAGITEPRAVAGWQVRLLAFRRPERGESTAPKPVIPNLETLPPEEQEEVAGVVKRLRWFKWVLWPITALAGFLIMALVGMGIGVAVVVNAVPSIRRRLCGAAATECGEFIRQLGQSNPPRIQISGNTVTNLRQDCRITLPPSARARSKPQRRKCSIGQAPVFEIDWSKEFLACTAYPSKGPPRYAPTAYPLLESLSLKTQEGKPVHFQYRLAKTGSRTWHQYEWDIHHEGVVYRFHLVSESDLSAQDLEELHQLVRSFLSLRPDT